MTTMLPDGHDSFRGDHLIVDRIRRSLYYGKVKQENEVTDCPSLPLTEVTVEMFERLLKQQSSGKTHTGSVSRGLSVLDMTYASAVSQKACISPCSIVLAIIYMERLRKKNPDYLKTSSPCDLFLVSLLVASKYLFDDGEDEEVLNSEWAVSGSLELQKLNRLEVEFLINLDWDLHVEPALFFAKLAVIEHVVAWKQTQLRGASLTYNELLSLDSCLQWRDIAPNVCSIMAFTLMTYAVVLVAVMSASVLTSLLLTPHSAGPAPLLSPHRTIHPLNHTGPCLPSARIVPRPPAMSCLFSLTLRQWSVRPECIFHGME